MTPAAGAGASAAATTPVPTAAGGAGGGAGASVGANESLTTTGGATQSSDSLLYAALRSLRKWSKKHGAAAGATDVAEACLEGCILIAAQHTWAEARAATHTQRARLRGRVGNAAGSLEDAEHVCALTPKAAAGFVLKGAALVHLNRHREAHAAYTTATRLGPSDAGTNLQAPRSHSGSSTPCLHPSSQKLHTLLLG